eukprot:10369891-Alexandrium_andersonii.AAC.1
MCDCHFATWPTPSWTYPTSNAIRAYITGKVNSLIHQGPPVALLGQTMINAALLTCSRGITSVGSQVQRGC